VAEALDEPAQAGHRWTEQPDARRKERCMTEYGHDRHIEVVHDGRVVGAAELYPIGGTTVRADLHVEAGHHAVGLRATLVDAVLDEAKGVARLEATLPAGDAEALERLRVRCANVQTRPAGATCLVDATLPDDPGHPTDPADPARQPGGIRPGGD
jgi:hypothetical protein